MDNQIMAEELWSGRMLQLTSWVEWLLPLLYCLMALVSVSLLFTLIDLAMLCWKEFHSTRRQQSKVASKAVGETKSVRFHTAKISRFQQRQQAGQ
ncbi:MAG: hypothetical protein JNK38_05050 [Acidobacteria bacterium]|nr:hypothetical protein [Acidobacteriota bacterium]